MSDFQVNPDELHNAATNTHSKAQRASSFPARVDAADVPTIAWGMLGLSMGMYPIYQAMLSDLSRHSQGIYEFLNWAGDNLGATADSYRGADETASDQMADILRQLDQ